MGFGRLLARFVVVLLCAGAAEARDLADGLVLHLQFDDNLVDSSGHGNHGVMFGPLAFVPGRPTPGGRALKFTPPSSRVVVYPAPELNLRDHVSISLWFRPESSQAQHYSAMFYKAAQAGSSPDLGYGDRSFALFWIPGGIHTVYTLSGDISQTVCTNETFGLAASQWHHLVFSFNSSAGSAELFLDNELKRECIFTPGTSLRPGSFRIGVGGVINQQAGDATNFNGRLDSVRLYDRILTRAEISQLFSLRL